MCYYSAGSYFKGMCPSLNPNPPGAYWRGGEILVLDLQIQGVPYSRFILWLVECVHEIFVAMCENMYL